MEAVITVQCDPLLPVTTRPRGWKVGNHAQRAERPTRLWSSAPDTRRGPGRCNGICPAFAKTALTRDLYANTDFMHTFAESVPLKAGARCGTSQIWRFIWPVTNPATCTVPSSALMVKKRCSGTPPKAPVEEHRTGRVISTVSPSPRRSWRAGTDRERADLGRRALVSLSDRRGQDHRRRIERVSMEFGRWSLNWRDGTALEGPSPGLRPSRLCRRATYYESRHGWTATTNYLPPHLRTRDDSHKESRPISSREGMSGQIPPGHDGSLRGNGSVPGR